MQTSSLVVIVSLALAVVSAQCTKKSLDVKVCNLNDGSVEQLVLEPIGNDKEEKEKQREVCTVYSSSPIVSPTCTNASGSILQNGIVNLEDSLSLLSSTSTGTPSDSESDGSDSDARAFCQKCKQKSRRVRKTITTTIIIKKEVEEVIGLSDSPRIVSSTETPVLLATPSQIINMTIDPFFASDLIPDQDFYVENYSEKNQRLSQLLGSGKYTVILLSRHCKTNNSESRPTSEGTPVEVDTVSFQAMKVAAVLFKFGAIFSGSTIRSTQSSLVFLSIKNDHSSVADNIKVNVLQELNEQNSGELGEGNIEDILRIPKVIDAFKNPTNKACSGGETGASVMDRSKKALCYITSKYPGKMVYVSCNRLFAYHTMAALRFLVNSSGNSSNVDTFYSDTYTNKFMLYAKMGYSHTMAYAIRKMPSSSPDGKETFAFIIINDDPLPLDSITSDMYSKILSGSNYINEMGSAEAENILKTVKTIKK
ncbi:MAG: histidine phosphatase family protein [Holosporaceae bacterium]|nr:histidine phosphatase family protein [Holosporaceae bacterium]